MSIKLVTAPSVKPLTYSDVGDHVRADLTAEGALVETYISAVTAKAETILSRAIITQTWELTLDSFPPAKSINPFSAVEIPLPTLQEVLSVEYLSESNVLTTLDPAEYTVDLSTTPGRIMPAYGKSWPSTLNYPGAVKIQFVSGYGDDAASVPDSIKAWMLLNIGTLYENRESVVIGHGGVIDLNTIADSLLDSERWEARI